MSPGGIDVRRKVGDVELLALWTVKIGQEHHDYSNAKEKQCQNQPPLPGLCRSRPGAIAPSEQLGRNPEAPMVKVVMMMMPGLGLRAAAHERKIAITK